MLRIVNLEEIERLLLEVPALIDRLETRSPSFTDDVRNWLKSAEQALQNNRIAVASTVASLRGQLTSVKDGFVPPEVEILGRPTRRKILTAVSTSALRQASEAVLDITQPDRLRIAEAERICRQIVAHAKVRNLIPEGAPSNVELAEYLRGVWHQLKSDPDLSQLTTHLVGLLGSHDVLIVLDRTITADAGDGDATADGNGVNAPNSERSPT